MKNKFRRTLLTAALALAAAPAFAGPSDSPFTQTVFFGDSLTDGGYFRPLLVQMLGPNGALVGQFTTNPGYVWSQYLADHYGSNAEAAWNGTTGMPAMAGGNNWAVGGARVDTSTIGGLGYTPSMTAQYQAYLASGNTVDPGALYTVWGGANDLFAVQADPSQAAAIIGGAVTAQVGIVGALTQAGAQYILVPTLPDVGLTPSSRAGGALGMAQGTALSAAYNDALFGGLASSGLRVIPLDTFHFLGEVVADPAAFGLSNVTGQACLPQPPPAGDSSLFCNPTSTVPGGADSYLFADGVHPSQAAHKALADFAVSVIDGPRLAAVLPKSAATVGRARAQVAAGAAQSAGADDGTYWWANVRGDQQRYNKSSGFDGIGPTGTFGVSWRRGSMVYGGFVGYGRQDIDFGQRRGDFRQTDTSLGGYLGWQSGNGMWASAQLSWTQIDYKIDRQVNLGQASRVHHGSTDGQNFSIGGSAGWNFGDGALAHGPVLSVLAQRISVDGYDEDSNASTALGYMDQDGDSLVGSIGWQASYTINDHVKPYARLTADHEFEDGQAQAWARSLSMPNTLPYAVPGLATDRTYGTLAFGVQSKAFGLDVTAGSNLTVGQKGGNDASFFLTVGGRF